MVAPVVLIRWLTHDGEEHEEQWPSRERFRAWAEQQPAIATWTAYAEDDDGEWVIIDHAE